ncbi:MAG: hypothetical protein SV760_02530, partial [Halobacteria archaeon]|nr:hypothetical protein [Halobacteria archaeon]
RTKSVTEVAGIDTRTGDLNSNRLFSWEAESDEIDREGNSVVLDDLADELGVSRSEMMRELDNRRRVLKRFVEEGVDGYKEFTRRVNSYYVDPSEMIEEVGGEVVDGILEQTGPTMSDEGAVEGTGEEEIKRLPEKETEE